MAANLNISIRPFEMYLMMASVCPKSQPHRCCSIFMNVERKPLPGLSLVRCLMEEALQTPGLSPGLRMESEAS